VSPVLTKTDFVQRYNAGEFGNRSPTWNSLQEFEVGLAKWANNDSLYHLRNRVAGGPTKYNVSEDHYCSALQWMLDNGVKPQDIYVSEMCPTHLTQIQGEVMRTHEGLYLYYSQIKKPMRDSLREGGREAKGLRAKMLLEYYMDTNSYEWLNTLLDQYSEHVVEFTTLSKCWGTNSGYNTLFWEVRYY